MNPFFVMQKARAAAAAVSAASSSSKSAEGQGGPEGTVGTGAISAETALCIFMVRLYAGHLCREQRVMCVCSNSTVFVSWCYTGL